MLYQPLPRTRFIGHTRRALGTVARWLAGVVQSSNDRAFLEGLRDGELEELGLRRGDDDSYRPFN